MVVFVGLLAPTGTGSATWRYYRGGWKITFKEIHFGMKPYQRRGGVTRIVKIYERRGPLGWQLVRGSVADKYNHQP